MSEPNIVCDPNIAFGKPTIAGRRIAVALIIEELGAGTTIDEVMENYDLTREQIQAAIRYTLDLLAQAQYKAPSSEE